MKVTLWVAMGVLACATSAFARGSIILTLTPYSAPGLATATVQVDLTITDTGGVPDCMFIDVYRRAVYPCGSLGLVQRIPRQLGTRSLQIVDTVTPNTSYRYFVVSTQSIGPPCDSQAFQREFDPYGYGFDIQAYTTVGPDPTPLVKGRLVTTNDATPNFALEHCSDDCSGIWAGVGGPEVRAYVDTGTELLLYGTAPYCCSTGGWMIQVTNAVPHPCAPVDVEARDWSDLKMLYRDATR